MNLNPSKKELVPSKIEGFTLVELLVVIVIIAVLASIGMVSYGSATKRARDAKRKSNLEQYRAALEMYRADNGSYPDSLNDLLTTYIPQLFTDPKGYSYYSSFSGCSSGKCSGYELCAYFEAFTTGDTACTNGHSCTAPSNCNYGVINP